MNWYGNSLGTENCGRTRPCPVTAVSKGLRTAKVWKRIEAAEISLGVKGDRNSQDEVLSRLLQQLSPEDLML